MQKRSNRLALRVLSTAAFLAMVSSCTTAAFADTYDLTKGSVTVNAKSDGTYVTQTDTDGNFCTNKNGDTLNNYEDKTPVTLTTSGEEPTHNTASISTEKGVSTTVTLDNVNIDASKTGKAAIYTEGKVTLELDGNNTLTGGTGHAALEKYSTASNNVADQNYTLTLQDETGKTGSLTATGGAGGAGIGGSAQTRSYANNITITGGTITATGGKDGAGIGGGKANNRSNGNATDITISGTNTTVNATGGAGGAGIGGGNGNGGYRSGQGFDITVEGGAHVEATGGAGGAGIGGGDGSAGGESSGLGHDITITGEGTTVTANGNAGGAGIGGGKGTAASAKSGGNGVTITDGTVTATGGKGAAGIGSGADSRWASGSFVDITGGKVTANGGAGEAAGIGNGENDAHDAAVKISATNAALDVTAVTQGSGEAITGENGVTMASLTNERSGVVRFFRSKNHYNTVHNGKYVGMDDNNADEHKKTDAHIWDSAKDEILQQATPAVQGIVRHHCGVDGCKGYYEEPFDYVAPAPTDPDTPDMPGTSDVTPDAPAQGTPDVPGTSDVAPDAPAQGTPDVPDTLDVTPDAPADAVPGAAAAEEVSVTPSRAQSVIAAALPQTGVNWLVAAVGSALSGMFLLAVGFVLKHKSRGQN